MEAASPVRHLSLRSRAVIAASYAPETETLSVTFANGRTYTHQGVPPEVARDLETATSPGSYYAGNIRGQY